jgi:hypothetical protein
LYQKPARVLIHEAAVFREAVQKEYILVVDAQRAKATEYLEPSAGALDGRAVVDPKVLDLRRAGDAEAVLAGVAYSDVVNADIFCWVD